MPFLVSCTDGHPEAGNNLEFQSSDSVSLLFIGDIMGHDSQINGALNDSTNVYDYDSVFSPVSKLISEVDFAIANLEVTLAGKPFLGYPKFSSPNELAIACKNNGIDVLLNANNHACDRSDKGIIQTITVLDSLDLLHTGTFKDSIDKVNNNLLILEKNNIRIGILNYTYDTNDLPAPPPTLVNYIDSANIVSDIQQSQISNLDKLIVFIHWGEEYESEPDSLQVALAKLMFDNGADIVIGSHPHVLQKMEYHPADSVNKERFIVYSLGNFVSGQRVRKRDGGAMVRLMLVKANEATTIKNAGYYLTWVDRLTENRKAKYSILPCAEFEFNDYKGLSEKSKEKMMLFTSDSRHWLDSLNINVGEIKYR